MPKEVGLEMDYEFNDDGLIKDIISWDVESWSKCLHFIDNQKIEMRNKQILDIGTGNGGLSLYCALRGGRVTCSDREVPSDEVRRLHDRYEVSSRICYKAIDAVVMQNVRAQEFEIVIFKGVLGHWAWGSDEQKRIISNIHRCLKAGGIVIFCDSMRGSIIHDLGRRIDKAVYRRKYTWHYAYRDEILQTFSGFELLAESYCGFIAPFSRAFGSHQWVRNMFGKIDSLIFEKVLPDTSMYIGTYIFKKVS